MRNERAGGTLTTVTTQENVKKVRNLLLQGILETIRQMVKDTGHVVYNHSQIGHETR